MHDRIRAIARQARYEASHALSGATTLDTILSKACDSRSITLREAADDELGAGTDGRLRRGAAPGGRPLLLLARGLDDVARRHAIAHELGHFDLHEERQETRAIRYEDAGEIRFDPGYSPRSVVERQAEVYAAEFLCPTDLLRPGRGRMRPFELAVFLGLDPILVLSQAVQTLLPQPELDGRRVNAPDIQDSVQRLAIAYQGAEALLVDGSPGAGKTTTIAARAAWLLDHGVAASAIAIIVHCDQAAIRLRAAVAHTHRRGAATMWIGTQTAFALEIVDCHCARVGLPSEFALLDRPAALVLLQRRLAELPVRSHPHLRSIASAITRSRRTGAAGRAPSCDTYDANDMQVAVEAVYEAAKIEESRVDRDDLFIKARNIVSMHEGVSRRFARLYPHVLVDDHQDLRRDCIETLRCLAKAGTIIFSAGNGRCAIRAYDGACQDAMSRFEQDFPGGTRVHLSQDHRSSAPIIHAASVAIARAGKGPRSEESVSVSAEQPPHGEAQTLAKRIGELVESGLPMRDQAILVRTNARAKSLLSELTGVGVPILHLGELAGRKEVMDLCAIAELGDDDPERQRRALERLVTLEAYSANPRDVARIAAVAIGRSMPIREVLETVAPLSGLSTRGRAGLARLGVELAGLPFGTSTWRTLATWLLDRSDYVSTLGEEGNPATLLKRLAIHETLRICEEQDAVGERGGRALSRRLGSAGSLDRVLGLSNLDLEACGLDAVQLMTIHAAQGREFGAVHLPVAASHVPTSSNRTLVEDDKLLFVAATRARRHLHILKTRRRSDPSWTSLEGLRFDAADAVKAGPLGEPQRSIRK